MSENTAIPKSLNLGSSKPSTIPAYTRRVESIATNAQTFGPGDFANIVLDTSTPGAFLDPQQSIFQFDVEITNPNPYIDYVNLSSGGMSSLIQEMRIYCQGTPVEEILDYNTMFEMFMDLGGYAQEEFKMYVENSWRAPVAPGHSDLNFVKPPMVDRNGVIMCPNEVNMFGDSNLASVHNEDGSSLLSLSDNNGVADIGLNTAFTLANNARHRVAVGSKWYGNSAAGNINSSAFTNRIDNTYVTWPSTVRPEPLYKSETRQRMEADQKKYRIQDYLEFLANVKNIPVGIKPAQDFIATGSAVGHSLNNATPCETNVASWNFAAVSQLAGDAKKASTKYTVSLPIFSGILGVWAEKQFPAMLISPGSFYFQIKFASAAQAFQVAMDPCRRVRGTLRDYIPNAGLAQAFPLERDGYHFNGEIDANHFPTSININSGPLNTGFINTTWLAITEAGATGNDYHYMGSIAPPSITTAGAFPNANANPVVVGNFQTFGEGRLHSTGLSTAATYDANGGMTGGVQHYEGGGQGYTTGNAKPQYLLSTTPWIYPGHAYLSAAAGGTLRHTCFEYQACFGTYLPCSTAQTRRCLEEDTGRLSFTISNLRYVGHQTILPDDVTAGIIHAASSSDISLNAQSVRTYRTQMAASLNQNIILPIKVASANSLWVVFQNTSMTDNFNYLSTTRTCPFTSFEWTPNGDYTVGSDTAPSFYSMPTTNAFSIQLRIGNELYPQQPITNLNQLVNELQRSVHGMGDMSMSLQTFASVRNGTSILGKWQNGGAANNDTETRFLNFKSGDFVTPYIPVAALDDQSITNNPCFMDFWNKDKDWVDFSDRGRFVYPDFLPPVSKFLLGFDLDTFPGTNDTARSGKYLGNAPLTLNLTNTYAAQNKPITNGPNANLVAIAMVLHDIRFSIMAGGQMLAYY